MPELWDSLPAATQDWLWLAALVAPALVMAAVLLRGFAPAPLVRAMLWRFRWTNLCCIALIAVSIGMGAGVITQERALRDGSARAADRFDMVITAPGSDVTMMLATVYLEITDAPLLNGTLFNEVANHPQVALAAPLAYGDSHMGAPVIGTTEGFVRHLAEGQIEGRMWQDPFEAIVGAAIDLKIGDSFVPAHGLGDAAQEGLHGDRIAVVGRMAPTGSPWDRAILVPAESVWLTHGLADGHAEPGQLGPPFDAEFFPGTPAIVVIPRSLASAYLLRQEFTRDRETMAFFPGAVLGNLHRLMGDVRQAMSVLTLVCQALVAAAVMLSLFILSRLFARQVAVLRALGAPGRFVVAVVWAYAMVLLVAGTLTGLVIGQGAAQLLSAVLSSRTELALNARIGWPELHLAAGFVTLGGALALLPALAALRRPIAEALRGG